MKKLLVLMMALVMTLSLTACGGGKTPAPEQNSSNETGNTGTATDAEFVPMTFGYVTLSVPSVFQAVTETQGQYTSGGPDSSIVVSPTLEIDIQPSEWNEEVAAGAVQALYSSTYTDIKLSAFEGDVDMNGNKAVYMAFYGKNSAGKDRLVQVVRLYNADLTAQYIITLMHSADDPFFTPEVGGKIINSITLSPDAQNLEAESEG